MLFNCSRLLPLVALLLFGSGCMDFNLGSGDTEIKGCWSASPASVTRDLESRYALGSSTALPLSGLVNPEVTSSNPDVVEVGPMETIADKEGGQAAHLVELKFVGVGEAFITVTESDAPSASATIEVAAFEWFQVVLPTESYPDPLIPFAGKAVSDPELEVAYFDRIGRLYGHGLAQTTWERTDGRTNDAFFNDSLEPGPNEVTVRVGHRASLIAFEAVEPSEVIGLEVLETEPDETVVRLDLVGRTESATRVWNIRPIFIVDGDLFLGSLEYIHDPDAPPTTVVAQSWNWSVYGALDGIETSIQGEPAREGDNLFEFSAVGGNAPLMALLSLLFLVVALRAGGIRRMV